MEFKSLSFFFFPSLTSDFISFILSIHDPITVADNFGSWLLFLMGNIVTPFVFQFAPSFYQAPPSMEFSRQEYWSGLPFLLQGIFPTQGSNPGLPHCRQTLYHLSYQGSHHFVIHLQTFTHIYCAPGTGFRVGVTRKNKRPFWALPCWMPWIRLFSFLRCFLLLHPCL